LARPYPRERPAFIIIEGQRTLACIRHRGGARRSDLHSADAYDRSPVTPRSVSGQDLTRSRPYAEKSSRLRQFLAETRGCRATHLLQRPVVRHGKSADTTKIRPPSHRAALPVPEGVSSHTNGRAGRGGVADGASGGRARLPPDAVCVSAVRVLAFVEPADCLGAVMGAT